MVAIFIDLHSVALPHHLSLFLNITCMRLHAYTGFSADVAHWRRQIYLPVSEYIHYIHTYRQTKQHLREAKSHGCIATCC